VSKIKIVVATSLVLGIGLYLLKGVNARAAEAHAILLDGTHLPFYVFHGFRSPDNHYAPSGWMGDYGDLSYTESLPADRTGRRGLRISYSAKALQGNGWAGIYWQHPANNWGSRQGGYNLNGATRAVFWARGEKGGEMIAEFKVGGISGDYPDSGAASLGPITLTKEWKEYTIALEGQELSSISGGFCVSFSRSDNPDGAVFYLDDIRYE
jgi:hypothetical protein